MSTSISSSNQSGRENIAGKNHRKNLPPNYQQETETGSTVPYLLCTKQRLLTLNASREGVGIINGRNLTKESIKVCVRCHDFSLIPTEVMADLPWERVTNGVPLTYTGILVAGPITTKPVAKTYIVKFLYQSYPSRNSYRSNKLCMQRSALTRGKSEKLLQTLGQTSLVLETT